MLPELTYYEIFQQLHYGNVLPERDDSFYPAPGEQSEDEMINAQKVWEYEQENNVNDYS